MVTLFLVFTLFPPICLRPQDNTFDSLKIELQKIIIDSLDEDNRLNRIEEKLELILSNEENLNSTAGNVIEWSGFILTVLVFLIGAGAWFAGNRFNEIEKIRRELSKLLRETRQEFQDELRVLNEMKVEFESEKEKSLKLVFPLLNAEVFFHRGEFSRALFQYRESIKIDPNSPEINRRYNQLLMYEGKCSEVISNLKDLLENDPNNSQYHNILAEAYRRLENYDYAKKHSQRALEIDPDLSIAAYELGTAELYSGNYIEAEKNFYLADKLFVQYDGFSRFYVVGSLAYCQWILGREDDFKKTANWAISVIANRLTMTPKHSIVLGYLGLVELLSKNYKGAVSAFAKSAEFGLKVEPAKSMLIRVNEVHKRLNLKSTEQIVRILEGVIVSSN